MHAFSVIIYVVHKYNNNTHVYMVKDFGHSLFPTTHTYTHTHTHTHTHSHMCTHYLTNIHSNTHIHIFMYK